MSKAQSQQNTKNKNEENSSQETEEDWELDYSKTGMIIGLEIHCQLNTLKTKLFCGCDAAYRNDKPNTHTCEICMGLPGTLPVTNKSAVESATKLALSIHSDIHDNQFFFRKNYYYPDMSRNYQITQYNRGGGVPFASGGHIKIKLKDGKEKKIPIDRMHLEDDPGKLSHEGSLAQSPYTLVDYNRCGTTLIELVTKPQMYNPKEAREFCKKYKTILSYIGISDTAKDGAFRVDANVSLEGYNRVEIKNIGSVKEVEKALKAEIFRQKQLIKNGKKIYRETRAWDGERTILLRTKEQEDDYRYFPEPDLVPFTVTESTIQRIEKELPELPDEKLKRYQEEFEMGEYDAEVLVNNKESADFFEKCVSMSDHHGDIINWLINDVQGYLNEHNQTLKEVKLTPETFVELIELLNDQTISTKIAKKILPEVIQGKKPKKYVKEQNLTKISDVDTLESTCEEILEENKGLVKAIEKNPNAFNALIGKLMKKTRGKADVNLAKKIFAEKIAFDLSQL